MALCQGALERGVFAQAIRPPSVPAGTARLRLTAMASHTPAELRRAARALGEAARAAGLEPEAIAAPAAAEPPATGEFDAASSPRGGSHALFDIEHATEPAVPAGAAPTPFDIEREDSHLTRAA
jgi:hypothetical protein